MPQRGLVRALARPAEVAEQGYPLRAGWWYSPLNRTGSNNIGSGATNENNNAFGAYVPLRYAFAFDAMACVVSTANAGAGAVVRLAAYQLPAGRRELASPSDIFGGSILLVDAGAASLNSTGTKTLTHQRVVARAPGLVVWMALQNFDTGGTRPAVDVASATAEEWIVGQYQSGFDVRLSPSYVWFPGSISNTLSGQFPRTMPSNITNHQGIEQRLPWITLRAAA